MKEIRIIVNQDGSLDIFGKFPKDTDSQAEMFFVLSKAAACVASQEGIIKMDFLNIVGSLYDSMKPSKTANKENTLTSKTISAKQAFLAVINRNS